MLGYFHLMRTVLFFLVISINCHVAVGLAAECTESFSWLPNSESDLDGYKIYYGTSNEGPYPNEVDIDNPIPVDGRVYGDIPGFTCGTQYYAVCVAYNTQGVKSSYSNQIEFIPPDPDGTAGTKVFGDVPGAARERVVNCFSREAMARAYLEVYSGQTHLNDL